MLLKKITDELWKSRRSSQLNFAPQKLGSLNWKPRISFIARGQKKRKNGSAEYILKSRRALFESDDVGQPTVVGFPLW
jgi:hypothetical protein